MAQVAIPAVYGDVDGAEVEEYGGYVARVTEAVYERVKPRWSALQREKLAQAGQPADDATLMRLLRGFPADWANSFARHNKLIGVERDIGDFVPRVPVAHDAGEGFKEVELEAYNQLDDYRADTLRKKALRDKKVLPKYFLHQVFSDVSVAEKLAIDQGMMIVMARVAVGDPKAACDLVVKHAKANGIDVAVRVGDYSKSRKASRQRLLNAAAGLTVEPYTCEVIGGNVAVRGVSGIGPAASWTITAELWQMPEVDAVYRLTSSKGVSTINTLFTADLVKLGVELTPDSLDYGFDIQLHVGEYDGSVYGNRVEVYGDDVVKSSFGVFPVVHAGKVVASAVYAGERQVFVNWHVVSGLHDKMVVDDSKVSVRLDVRSDRLCPISLLSEVASDVWLAELEMGSCEGLGVLQPPVCRAACPGEEVVALYAVPTGVESTDPVRVEQLDVGTVCMPRFPQARSGMSGAALVALKDGALLGSYTGSNRTYSLGSSLHLRNTADWMDSFTAPLVAPHAFVTGKGAGAVYHDLRERGLGNQIAAVSAAILPLVSRGRGAGNQYVHGAGAVTVLDPGVWDLVDSEGRTMEFVSSCEGGVRPLLDGEVPGPSGRSAVLGEKVFAVHKDDKGVIFSELLGVTWVSSCGDRCRLDGVPQFEGKVMKGAVLVALSDCATLGMIMRVEEASWGSYAVCATWSGFFNSSVASQLVVAKQGLFERLADRFPCLKTSTWEKSDVKTLVVGDVPAAGAYSRLGVAATLAAVLGKFSQQDMNGVERAVTAKLSDDSWMLALCDRVLPGRNRLFGISCADKLNTMKIFFGLVYLREGSGGLDYVLDELGLFRMDSYEGSDYGDTVFSVRPRSV